LAVAVYLLVITSSKSTAVAINQELRQMDAALRAKGGAAMGGADDIYPVGRAEDLLEAVEEFGVALRDKLGLTLAATKCEIYCQTASAATTARRWLARPRAQRRLPGFKPAFVHGIKCYGVPLGGQEFVESALQKKAGKVVKAVGEVSAVLSDVSRQSEWQLIRLSLAQRFDYWMQHNYPSDVVASGAAETVDRCLWEAAVRCHGWQIPPGDEKVVERRARLPIRYKGLGLRSHEETYPMAFMGSLEHALPKFSMLDASGDQIGMRPALGSVLGMNSFRENGEQWVPLLQSQCRTGQELGVAWRRFKDAARTPREAEDPAFSPVLRLLGEECFAVDEDDPSARDLGKFAAKGTTRTDMVQEVERVRAARLLYDLTRGRRRDDHIRMAYEYCCPETSGRWAKMVPTSPERWLDNRQFSEVSAKHMGLPSPAAMEQLGQGIAGKLRRPRAGEVGPQSWEVDAYGDVVHSLSIEDNYTQRHDGFKWELERLMRWADVQCNTEVYGLFAALVAQGPHEAKVATKRKRQALVPDFQVGGSGLAELKFIGAIPTFYPSPRLAQYRGGGYVTPVMRRVLYYPREGGIQAEYEAKAKSVDGPLGLVQRRLQALGKVQGWVVGAYGELSDDLLGLVKVLAESKLKVPLAGAPGAASVVVEYVRDRMGMAAVKAQADFLLSGLRWCGPGGAAAYAARRDQKAAVLEGQAEMRAQYFATFVGHQLFSQPRPR
jgi:hypothetical protein